MMNNTDFNIMSIGKVMKSRGLVALPAYFSSVSHAEKVCSHAKRETPLGIRLSNLPQSSSHAFIFLPGQTFHKEKLQPNIKQLRDACKIPKSLLPGTSWTNKQCIHAGRRNLSLGIFCHDIMMIWHYLF